ncbi:serine protease ami-like [Cimex lectularius]|uniref:Peptidase S1 domain-containing protein n=1 Tax=Cimex lectularius TaxID=79782 RepID=A0A8I6S8B0_CIMLE|nr:serine protease ami-like [Cimex lectularius]
MSKFEVFIQVFFATLSVYTVPSSSHNKMAGEGFAFIKQFPFIVSVQEFGKRHICSGTLVSMGHVLTTARCVSLRKENSTVVFTREPEELSVVSGLIDLTSYNPKKQNRTVRGVYLHPGYGFRNIVDTIYLHDMAIVELSKIFIKDYFTMTAPFSPRKDAADDLEKYKNNKAKCLHTGWQFGSTGKTNKSSTKLKFVKMVLMTNSECSIYLCSLSTAYCKNLQPDLMCAVPETRVSSFTDAGGPLICKGKIFGLNIYNEETIGGPKPKSLYITISDINNFIYLVKDFSCRTTAGYAIIFELLILIVCSKLHIN